LGLSARGGYGGQVDGQIEEIARDHNANWMTALEMLDDDTYIGAENHFNLFTCRKNTDATTDEERGRLEVVGEYHLGDLVNRFRAGSLVMRGGDSDGPAIPTLLFGTVNGVIGVVATLPKEDYELMLKVQTALNQASYPPASQKRFALSQRRSCAKFRPDHQLPA